MIIIKNDITINTKKFSKEINEEFNNLFLGFNFYENPNEDFFNKYEFIFSENIDQTIFDNLLNNHDSKQYENFIYNKSKSIDYYKNFRQSFLYNLIGDDVKDWSGDEIQLNWYIKYKNTEVDSIVDNGDGTKTLILNSEKQYKTTDLKEYIDHVGVLAIKETRNYERTKTGVLPSEIYTLKKETTIRYYRENGEFEDVVLNLKLYSEYDRKKRDSKSRSNIIEKVRTSLAVEIQNYWMSLPVPEPENIILSAHEFLKMFEGLSDQLSAYRNDREKEPLFNKLEKLLSSYILMPNENDIRLNYNMNLIPDLLIQFIIDKVNIDLYP